MRQLIIGLCLAGSFIVFSLTINLFDTLFMFLLFGILPNRPEPLTADQMLGMYVASSVLIVLYLTGSTFVKLLGSIRPQRRVSSNAT